MGGCLVAGCGAPAEVTSLSPTARPDILEGQRADLAAVRHPSDGSGSVELLESPQGGAVAGGRGRYRFRFTVGEHGIAVGGSIFLQVHPFWGWSTPQTTTPSAPGFTEVTATASLDARAVDQQLLRIEVLEQPLAPGEVIEVTFGAGPALAYVDRYAEEASPFWFSVDGNADGIRGLLSTVIEVPILPAQVSRFTCRLPSRVEPGQEVDLTVAALDAAGNFVSDWSGVLQLERVAGEYLGPSTVEVTDGSARVAFRAPSDGVVRLMVRAAGTDEAALGRPGVSNPMVVESGARPVLWADLHGHSVLSDGTGSPRDFYRYARDVARLDIAALTDHDHWGMRPLAGDDEMWRLIQAATEDAYEPGRFVTLLGYEWTSWIHGHRHVLYFSGEGVVHSAVDPEFQSPNDLWLALEGTDAMTFAHHSAGGPVATNWDYAPDPRFEPLTEITSVHGSSEAPDSPFPIYSAVAGNYVRDALDRGYELGFIGSGDSHDGHPGKTPEEGGKGGLAAVMASSHTREGVREALFERRVYATNGPRIVLDTVLTPEPSEGAESEAVEYRMGQEVPPLARARLTVAVVAEGAISHIDVVRSGGVVDRAMWQETFPRGKRSFHLSDLADGEYVYVRVIQADGGAAWSSPFFVKTTR